MKSAEASFWTEDALLVADAGADFRLPQPIDAKNNMALLACEDFSPTISGSAAMIAITCEIAHSNWCHSELT